jgi:hypothetical protein
MKRTAPWLWIIFLVAASACALGNRYFAQPARAVEEAAVPKHILTWALDGARGGKTDGSSTYMTNSASRAHIQTWVNWAQGSDNEGHLFKNGQDCTPGSPCIPVVYFEATRMRVNPGGACGDNAPINWEWYQQATESQFKHYAGAPMSPANRIVTRTRIMCNGGYQTLYYPNLNDPGYQAFWRRVLQSYNADGDYTEFLSDSYNSALSNEVPFGMGLSAQRGNAEVPDQETAEAHHKSFAAAMYWPDGKPMKIFGNGAFGPIDARGTPHLALAEQQNIIGSICEGCIATGVRVNPQNVGWVLDTMADLHAYYPTDKYIVLNGRSQAPAGSTNPCGTDGGGCGQIPARLFQLGVIWVGFSSNVVDWSNFANFAPTILAVYPEQSLFPTDPVRTMGALSAFGRSGTGCSAGSFDPSQAGGAKDLVVSCGRLWNGRDAGVYVREFRKCYNFGQLVGSGQCGVILNATSESVTPSASWKYPNGAPAFTQRYTTSLVVNGGDVLSAGCNNNRCPSSALNPQGASFSLGSTQVPPNSAVFVF